MREVQFAMKARSNCSRLLYMTVKEDHQEKGTTSCYTTSSTKEISTDAAVAKVLKRLVGIFTLKSKKNNNTEDFS